VEHRGSRRYRLEAPATFWWKRPDGLLREGQGAIRDVSDRGVYVAGNVAPALGAHLEVDVHLPAFEAGSGAVQLHGEGTVVRVDRSGNDIQGFAAAVTCQTESATGPMIVDPKKLH
jgi:hypothetical protein